MQFYLINICPKLHHRKWRKLRVTLPVNMSTVPNCLNFTINSVICPVFLRKLCYKLPSIVSFISIHIFDQNYVFLPNGVRIAAFVWCSGKIRTILHFGFWFFLDWTARENLSILPTLMRTNPTPASSHYAKSPHIFDLSIDKMTSVFSINSDAFVVVHNSTKCQTTRYKRNGRHQTELTKLKRTQHAKTSF